MSDVLRLRIVARFQREAAAKNRKDTQKLVKPINAPKGISKEVVREQARTESDSHDDTVEPDKKDIQPSDVFQPKPKNINVLDFAQKGWPGKPSDYKDMEHAVNSQIPKDKGYDTVSNLSQYLISTEGGGGTKPVGVKKK